MAAPNGETRALPSVWGETSMTRRREGSRTAGSDSSSSRVEHLDVDITHRTYCRACGNSTSAIGGLAWTGCAHTKDQPRLYTLEDLARVANAVREAILPLRPLSRWEKILEYLKALYR